MFFDGFGLGFFASVVLVFVMTVWHSGDKKEAPEELPVIVEQNPGKWDIEL